MSPATANVAPGWYGAFELKRTYQRNMSLGVLYAALFHLAIIGGMLIYQYIKSRDDFSNAQVVVIKSISDIAPPPSMTAAKPQVNVAEPNIVPPKIGIPTPVPDEEVVEDVKFATRAELAELQTPIVAAGNGGNDSVVVDIPLEEYFPAQGEFVAVEEMPVIIKQVDPDYPQVARLTKQEATVTVSALVDKEGKVRDVKIVKGSGSNIGFDEAAQEAAFKTLYKPAVQNGHPVAIWVTYQYHFRLK
ncbi:MAG: energy transducer TonB [candidate division Zixibacteria bacterium]|nr:energy transducer TonB [candidate division Zixibacteria bacterium]